MKNNQPKKILVVKLSAIGDVLMATPVAHALRTAFPDSHITWVVEKKSADVITGNPYLDDVVIWNRVKYQNKLQNAIQFIKNLYILRQELHSRRFDVCVDLQGLLRSALVCILSGAKRRIGFADANEGSAHFYHDKYDPSKDHPNAIQRNLDLLKKIGVDSTDTAMYMPMSEDDHKFADDFYEKNNLNGEKVIVFLPATTWVNKHWVPEGWSELADLVAEKYCAKPLILGSKADITLAEKISDGARNKPIIAAGQTTLKQAGALMQKCVVVIGVDTGLLHMAVALDKPSIGLFGASVWRCFIKKDNFAWVFKDFDCSPCLRRPTCKDTDCMKAIKPEDIDLQLQKLSLF